MSFYVPGAMSQLSPDKEETLDPKGPGSGMHRSIPWCQVGGDGPNTNIFCLDPKSL